MVHSDDSADRFEHLLERWHSVELGVGMVLVALGFLAVGLGWVDASGTADVRRQLQALISGGFGGLALVLLGSALVTSHVSARNARRLERQLSRVADAVLDLAFREQRDLSSDEAGSVSAPMVLASSASYHLAGCDLTDGRDGLREMPLRKAVRLDLEPCGVCKP